MNVRIIIAWLIFITIIFSVINSAALFDRIFPYNKMPDPVYSSKVIDPVISDSISYREYIQLRDSILTFRYLKNGDDFAGRNTRFDNFGTSSSPVTDTGTLAYYRTPAFYAKTPKMYYLNLYGWTLNLNDKLGQTPQFFVEKGQAYLRKHTGPLTRVINGEMVTSTLSADYPVSFRYNHLHKHIMIPISKHQSDVLRVVFKAMGIAAAAYGIFLFILFLRFVVDLSKGRVFISRNITFWWLVAVSFLAYVEIMRLANYLMRFIFSDYFVTDVVYKPTPNHQTLLLLTGVIAFILYIALQSGKKIKDEQDLTI